MTMSVRQKVFPYDTHGRLLITLNGLGLMGQAVLVRMESRGLHPTPRLRKFLTHPDYDEKHRLEFKTTYMVALVFGHEIPMDTERTTARLRDCGERDYGKSPDMRAELAVLLGEAITAEQMEQWGIWSIAVLHEPIVVDGSPSTLILSRYSKTCPIIVSFSYEDDNNWSDMGAFAFPVSQK